MTIAITTEQLRSLIGTGVRYGCAEYCIVEVLEDGPAIVLQDRSARDGFQHDQFGGPGRRVSETRIVPVLSADRSELHDEFLTLELLD